MENLFRLSTIRINANLPEYKRYLPNEIDWDDKLIGIVGARGTGKTTILLQHIKYGNFAKNEALYISADNIYFSKGTLFELAEEFHLNGGKKLLIDEVHKYNGWSRELKNIYDHFPSLYVIFTGSSALDIYKGEADLSRRLIKYNLKGFSFREYLELELKRKFPRYNFEEIIHNHEKIASEITKEVKIIPLFKEYLKYGYYPFYREGKKKYFIKLYNTLLQVLETDIMHIFNIDFHTINKIKALLGIIAESVPFTPNITKISERMESSRNTVLSLLSMLHKAEIVGLLRNASKGTSTLSKPEKIYLNNTNLINCITPTNVNIGNIRETFFYNQLNHSHILNTSKKGDFLVDNKFTFEIGGRNKKTDQVKGLKNSFVAKDDIEIGYMESVPIWLFGFMY